MNIWQTIGRLPPKHLTEARLQLHYAIQLIAATGGALVEPLPDDSHVSAEWHPELEVFMGGLVRTTHPFRVALEPVSLTALLLTPHDETIASFPLEGQTLLDGLTWLRQEIEQLGVQADQVQLLSYPPNDFPDHAIAHGATFDIKHELALSELTDYYANTYHLLKDITTNVTDASAIRIWSHHFDIATLITLPGRKHGNPMTVGVGLSPGDTQYAEPYWYVSPYPYPATDHFPNLASQGFWHTQHWVGAVLTASQLTDVDIAEVQAQQVHAFLDSAIAASIALLKSDLTPVVS
jgi:hypothetical protein